MNLLYGAEDAQPQAVLLQVGCFTYAKWWSVHLDQFFTDNFSTCS